MGKKLTFVEQLEKEKKELERIRALTRKANWKREWTASNLLNRISRTLDTNWDEDYKLYKITKTIEEWHEH